MTDLARQLGLEPRRLAAKWGWFVALGVVMVIAGGFALGDTVLVTLISVIFIGAALLIAGIFQIVHAFANKGMGSISARAAGRRALHRRWPADHERAGERIGRDHRPANGSACGQRHAAHRDGAASSRV